MWSWEILGLTLLLNCGMALMQLWICRSGSFGGELRGLLSVWSGDSEDEEQFVPAQWIGTSAYSDASGPSGSASEEEQP